MIGILRELAEHKLNIYPRTFPVWQKKRAITKERSEAITTEVSKLVEARILKAVFFPKWVSNPVMVKKTDGTWHMCIDFTSLNKACPKDIYPLPKIDEKVKLLEGFKLKCFLDAYKGYHQIRMAKEDEEKTSFHTEHGAFCYEKMSFGLKNAGATYQRLMDNMFATEVAFHELKSHLQSLRALTVPMPGETLILYLAATTEAISAVLSTKRGHVQKPIYFVSRSLQGSEINYPTIEKAENVINMSGKSTSTWTLFTNSASSIEGSGAGLILTDPNGQEVTYALRFNFRASNNKAEYEALVVGLELAIQMEARCLEVYTDSLLIGNQVKGLYEAREDIMKRYLAKVRELQGHFNNFTITQIPRQIMFSVRHTWDHAVHTPNQEALPRKQQGSIIIGLKCIGMQRE
ncbi:reverse transcriptase domain-containing protein [Tanacetum coccineum]